MQEKGGHRRSKTQAGGATCSRGRTGYGNNAGSACLSARHDPAR